jgi:hypothetical protein
MMQPMARAGLILVALAATAASLQSLEATLDSRALGDAVAIGQSRIDSTRDRLHAAYHIGVNRAPIEYIEIVTPFRRVVLDAETSAREGRRLYGQREALAALGSNPERVDIVVEMTFHPQNTFVGVPGYTVFVQPDGPDDKDDPRLRPIEIARIPRFGPRMEQTYLTYPYTAGGILPNLSQPLLGGRLVAVFDGRTLMAHPRSKVIVLDGNQELAVAGLDVGTMR